MNQSTIHFREKILLSTVVSFILGILIGGIFLSQIFNNNLIPAKSQHSKTTSEYTFLNDLEKFVSENFLGQFKSLADLERELGSEYIKLLNDPYSFYLTPENAEKYLNSLSGDYYGIGVVLGTNKDKNSNFPNVEITSVIRGGAAYRDNRIKLGSFILAVDNQDVTNLSPSQVSALIRGEVGTYVTIKLISVQNEIYEVTLQREQISVPKVEVDLNKFKNIDYISISDFVDRTVEEYNAKLSNEFSKLLINGSQNLEKDVWLDLRGNSGGYVQSARAVADYFLDQGATIFYEKNAKGKIVNQVYSNNTKLLSYNKIYILVDAGTASSAEILTLSLSDNLANVTIVGTSTFGKGSEQTMIKNFAGSGGLLNLTFQNWVSPSGKVLSKDNPIKPDILIPDIHLKELEYIYNEIYIR